MALTLLSNVSSLTAQNSLSQSTNMLNKTLQQLSTGLRINSGADDPAGLVKMEEQQAQITGLQTALNNTSEATSLVSTAEGALSEINNLLIQIRGLALDSANSAVQDPTSLAADQAQVANALSTIDRIAANTQFGTKAILNGGAGLSGTSTSPYISFLNANTTSNAGTYAVDVTQAAKKALVVSGFAQNGNTLTAAESLTINGVTVNLAAGLTQAGVEQAINQVSSSTGVTADSLVTQVQSSANYTTGGGAANATSATDLTTTDQFSGINVGDQINYAGTDKNGNTITGTFTYTGAAGGQTLGDLAAAINTSFGTGGTVSVVGGQLQVDAGGANGTASVSLSLSKGTTYTGSTFIADPLTATNAYTRLSSNRFGSSQQITVQSNISAPSANSSGFSNTQTTANGQDVAGTIGGFAANGTGNVLTGTGQAAGITVAIGSLPTNSIQTVNDTIPNATGDVTIQNNSLVFQIGANANQTASIAINNVGTVALGLNVPNNQFANLSQVNIQTEAGAQSTIAIVDAANSEISTIRGTLGAFQSQTLQATAANLQSTLTNTTSAESVIANTDYAAATSNLAQDQVLVQAGTTVLSTSNQQAQLVLALLQGK
ncbi:MAG TPA: flagellin [Gemmataceae bacterium]|nr:flagellin [Gemmataceae bacterium]